MRQNVKVAVLGLFFLLLAGFNAPAFGATADELKKQIADKNIEIQKLEDEIKQFQGSISETQANAKTLKTAIAVLNNQIKVLNSQIALTTKKISKKELEIIELKNGIGEAEFSMHDRQRAMGEILAGLSRAEEDTILETFLKYGTLSDFFTELDNINLLNGKMRQNYNELIKIRVKLQTQKSAAENANKDLKNLKGDLVDQKQIETQGKNEKSNLLTQTKNQEAAYQKLLKDREAKRAEIYAEIRAIESQLVKLVDLSSLPSFGSGVLLRPIAGANITQLFGNTAFAKITDVYANGFHNGIDFSAQIGTPVLTAEAGLIKATGDADIACYKGSYGKWILIEHPNKLATLYAHLSLIKVVKGQAVSRGAIIASSGNTGYTTGPHLHFTVYDARTVQFKPSRVCGVLPYGGYLDPMLYI
ncbi:MAG: peptidoglycan DD-metalloendopeptidase family protein [bacterium]|nr:peptidoglycan DD-metalloendopeptidase family protein [bacterium]